LKGIIFNLLEEAVTAEYGAQTWDELLAAAGADGAYTSLGSYSDDQLQSLVEVAASRLGRPRDEVLLWFGRTSMPILIERYPKFFDPHPSARELLLSVNQIIHPEVLKIYPGAIVPVFEFRDAPDGGLLMGYRSPRRFCALAQGFAEAVGLHYGQQLVFDHLECMQRGDSRCLAHITFAS